jgi:hypothetical protein
MKRIGASTIVCALILFLIGCDETVKQTILDGIQDGLTVIATSLITALYEILSGS